MKTSQQTRNTGPMIEARRRQIAQQKVAKAIAQLVALGWVRSITEHGLTLTEPLPAEAVKTDTNV
jgi:Mn-dependent DtxR family transcriptional regulator